MDGKGLRRKGGTLPNEAVNSTVDPELKADLNSPSISIHISFMGLTQLPSNLESYMLTFYKTFKEC